MLDDVPEPRLLVEGDVGDLFATVSGERYVDHRHAVATAGIEADRVLYQASEACQVLGAPWRTSGVAGGRVDLDLVVHHHRHRQAGHAPLLLTGVADGTVQLEVLGALLALVRRVRREHRLAGGRVHDLLAVGIHQRLARLYGRGRGSGTTGGLRC